MCFVKIDVESLTKVDEISDRQGIVVRFSGIIRNNGIHTVWGCSSVGRAPALQAGGHGFESHHLHQSNSERIVQGAFDGTESRQYGLIAQLVRARA